MARITLFEMMNNIIAWILVIALWYVAVFPFINDLFGGSDFIMFWVANIGALLILKAMIKEKIEELLRY
jgi:hypothetical protein